jgi:tryptophan-rich sensory protein
MKISWLSVLVIIALVIVVAVVGRHFSSMNRDWYEQLNKPPLQPPDWAFPVAWNLIFLLSTISLILIWNSQPRTRLTYAIMVIAVINGLMNISWSWLFFSKQLILPAIYDAGLICLSVIAIIIIAWRISKVASLLFLPYAAWTLFATYLTWAIYTVNKVSQ